MKWFPFGPAAQEPTKKLPVIDRGLCSGCGLCLVACTKGCLAFSWNLANLKRPECCTSEGHCAAACPDGFIEMKWVAAKGERGIGEWSEGGVA